MQHIFIINPVAGRGRSLKARKIIKSYCQKHVIDYLLIDTKYPNQAKEIAANYYFNDDVCLYAVGGDGTANEVMNGLNDKVQMAIIPAGSGNDFFGSLTEENIDLEKLIEETISGVVTKVDYGLVNNKRFMNFVSIGFDAEVNHTVNTKTKNNKLIPLKVIYYYTAISMAAKPQPFNLRYIVDGVEYNQNCLLFLVANGIRYGGGFHPAPMAKINDGLLNICAIDYIKFRQILRLLPVYKVGKHVGLEIAKMRTAKEIELFCDKTMNISIDGEIISGNKVRISLQEGILNLRVPKWIKEKLECE